MKHLPKYRGCCKSKHAMVCHDIVVPVQSTKYTQYAKSVIITCAKVHHNYPGITANSLLLNDN